MRNTVSCMTDVPLGRLPLCRQLRSTATNHSGLHHLLSTHVSTFTQGTCSRLDFAKRSGIHWICFLLRSLTSCLLAPTPTLTLTLNFVRRLLALTRLALGLCPPHDSSLVTRHSTLTIGGCPPCSRGQGRRRPEGTAPPGSYCRRGPCT